MRLRSMARTLSRMLRNSAKSNWSLEELGWDLVPPGRFEEWDGLLGWYLDYLGSHTEIQKDAYLGRWFRAGKACMEEVIER